MTKKLPVENLPEKIDKEIKHQVHEATVPVPETRRRISLVEYYLIISTLGFILLAIAARYIPYFPIDLFITIQIQKLQHPVIQFFMELISAPGFPPAVFVVVGIVSIILLVAKMKIELFVSIINAASISVITLLLKTTIQRERPAADLVEVFRILKEYSFPSGHVIFYTSYFGFIFFLIYVLLKRGAARSVLLVIFGLFIIMIAPSRIYLGQHWASDTLGAYLLGTIWLILTIFLYDRLKKNYQQKKI
jgi:membrane-associated phospholipid phosphatase